MNEKPIIKEKMRDQLRKPLPLCAVSQHPTKSYLSTIKAIYVVERLNDVFGVGEWHVKNEVIEKGEKMIVVKSTLFIPKYDIEIENFGGNDNVDRGDAYKGACTDALTKICSYLEIGIDVFKGQSTSPKSNSVKQETSEKELTCPQCGKGTMKSKEGKFGKFYGCSNYPECKKTLKYEEWVKLSMSTVYTTEAKKEHESLKPNFGGN